MTTKLKNLSAAILAAGLSAWGVNAIAEEVTTTTRTVTTEGAFTEFVPASKTIVLRTETAPARYFVTEETRIVDQTGQPVVVEQIPAGSPLTVHYVREGDRVVASRIEVRRPARVVEPAATERRTTTVTTTRPLTEDEREAREDAREERKERLEERIERRQERLEEAKDRIDD